MQLQELQKLAEDHQLEGVYDNIPNEVYHHPDCPGISKSDLDLIRQSYRHWLAKGQYPKKAPTPALLFGSAFHDLILLPDLFPTKWGVKEEKEKKPKEKKKTKKELAEMPVVEEVIEEQPVVEDKRHLFKEDEWEALHSMRDQFLAHPIASQIMDGAKCEQTIFWRDKKTNILCKCRPDIMRKDGILADLKTSSDGSFNVFRKDIVTWSYDKQAAHYLMGASAATGRRYESFLFIVVEKVPPYCIAIYNVNEAVLEAGAKLREEDLDKFFSSNKDNRFGYPIEIQEIDMAAFGFSIGDRA
jgi:exodeoxyribonuclease VIII